MMRVVGAVLLALSLAAAGPSEAARGARKGAKPRPAPAAEPRRLYDDRDRHRWTPQDAEQLRFGSRLWLEQMEREGRFGGQSNEPN